MTPKYISHKMGYFHSRKFNQKEAIKLTACFSTSMTLTFRCSIIQRFIKDIPDFQCRSSTSNYPPELDCTRGHCTYDTNNKLVNTTDKYTFNMYLYLYIYSIICAVPMSLD